MYMARCKVISDSAPNYGLIILENRPTDGSDKNLNGLFRIFSRETEKEHTFVFETGNLTILLQGVSKKTSECFRRQ